MEECLVFDSVVTYTSLTRIKDAPKRGSWDENADNDDDDDDDDIDEDLSESQKGEETYSVWLSYLSVTINMPCEQLI